MLIEWGQWCPRKATENFLPHTKSRDGPWGLGGHPFPLPGQGFWARVSWVAVGHCIGDVSPLLISGPAFMAHKAPTLCRFWCWPSVFKLSCLEEKTVTHRGEPHHHQKSPGSIAELWAGTVGWIGVLRTEDSRFLYPVTSSVSLSENIVVDIAEPTGWAVWEYRWGGREENLGPQLLFSWAK